VSGRLRPVILPAVLVASALGLWLWAGARRLEPASLNLVIVTLDTTRADRLGAYGYARALTPALDALAARGTLFEQALTSSPMTLPAHATLFTGLEPPEHGLMINGTHRLAVEEPTLAEILQTRGYRTAAFIGAFVLDSRFGLDRGFEVYDDDLRRSERQDIPERLSVSRAGDEVVDRALAWLRGVTHHTQPFFCWVHLYDPHYPYRGHRELAATALGESPSYDAEVAFADVQVGRLLRFLREASQEERTLVVAVGDHGEGLGDHGEAEHGYLLNEEVLRVPAIVSLPGRLAQGHRVSGLVSLIDLWPTILEVLRIPAPRRSHGRSLYPALLGGDASPEACYAETDLPQATFGWSPQRSLTTSRWKYIRTTRPELYDRRRDRAELSNLAAERPRIVAKLEARLSAVERRFRQRSGGQLTGSSAIRERLEALGYVAPGATSPAGSGPRLRDMKDMLEVKHLATALIAKTNAGQLSHPEQLQIAEDLVRRSPESPSFRARLGALLLTGGSVAEAVAELAEAVRLRPEQAESRANLGAALLRQGKIDEAIRELRQALALDPDMPEAHLSLGNALGAHGSDADAFVSYADALRLRPDYVEARINLANVLARRGENSRAAAHYRCAVRQRSDTALAHSGLATVLSRQGKTRLATAHARDAVRLAPDFVPARFQLAQLLAEEGMLEEAIEQYLAAVRLRPEDAELRDNLAAAYAAAGRFPEAIEAADKAAARARAARQPALAREIARRAALYRRMGIQTRKRP
jgi:arylsulfatase A-like enzyme/Flp pilus assembly protein TadD